jgi:3-isopropylmalate/(R)-2-methylmalate dehydratase small subunit
LAEKSLVYRIIFKERKVSLMKCEGSVIKYGDNVDTDVIIPARYLNTFDEKELAKHCMEDIDKTFVSRVKPGDIMVGGLNFGCGSSREHAPIAIKASGISCIIAKSFARIFYRNAINIGLPIIECPECSDDAEEKDKIGIDLDNGVIINYNKRKTYTIQPFPEFIQEIIKAGGLMKYIRQ